MVINILGTDYTIEKKALADDDCLLDCDGYCDMTSKRIVVTQKQGWHNLDCFEKYQKKVLRHEIIHAFMYESGLAGNFEHKNIGQEETIVDWFAIQGLKVYNAWKQADCI